MASTLFDPGNLNGDNGFTIAGLNKGELFGRAVSNAGDVNGDGLDDLLIGAPGVEETYSSYGSDYSANIGKAYVIFNNSDGFDPNFDIESLDGSNGFAIPGISDRNFLGDVISNAGDINGDGFDDLIIGVSNAGDSSQYSVYQGETYVIFGKSDGFAVEFDLNSLNGSNGFKVAGVSVNDSAFLGESVSNGGDVNGDGFDDIILGAPGAGEIRQDIDYGYGLYDDNRGEAYIIFGKSDDFAADFDLNSLDGTNGFKVSGRNEFARLGRSVSNAGDFNGDGFDDIILGAPDTNITNDYSRDGEAYVVFGKTGGFTAKLNVSSLDGSNGFAIPSIDAYDDLGTVSNAGDVNGDGFDDIIVGAPYAGEGGEAYVIFGKSDGFTAKLDLSNLDGSNGFTISGLDTYDDLGEALSNAGDLNGDGFDDIIIGVPYAGEGGEAYVIFGKSDGFAAEFDLTNVNRDEGIVIQGVGLSDSFGAAVSNAGDIDGDGLEDLIVGAPSADTDTNDYSYYSEGEAYIIFDFQASNSVATEEADTLIGGIGNDSISGLGGSDLLEGLGGEDELFGGSGDDLIRGGVGNDRLYGNLGEDSLFGEAGNDFLVGNNGRDLLRGGKGKDVLEGGAGKDALEGGNDSDRLFGNRGNDSIYSGNGDDTLKGSSGADTLVGGKDNDLLQGGEGNDRLVGVALNESSDFGINERDTLTGGAGSDIFVLGNQSGVFYDDGNNFSSGDADFARLRDFDPLEDTVQLFGSAEEYVFDFLPSSSGNLDLKLDYVPKIPAGLETIALIEDVSADLSLNDSAFVFV